MNARIRSTALAPLALSLTLLAVPGRAAAKTTVCEMKFNLKGWSAFYKVAHGQGKITCDNGQKVELVFNGNGDFTPGHVVGSTAVYVVQSLDVTQETTPPGGPTSTKHFFTSKSNVHGDLITCTFDITRTGPAGTFHGYGTLVVFTTPAK